jgi:hypothetical protein
MRYSGTVFRLAQSSLAAPFSFKRTFVVSTGTVGGHDTRRWRFLRLLKQGNVRLFELWISWQCFDKVIRMKFKAVFLVLLVLTVVALQGCVTFNP